jgi:DNA-binding response OmpR family regulator
MAQVDADIYVASDGQAAIVFIDSINAGEDTPCPDLVLLDMNLPKKNGNDVLKHLRSSNRCAQTLVLIVSSSHTPRDRAAIADYEVSGYFRKPSEYAEFMKLGPIVKRLLDDRKVE